MPSFDPTREPYAVNEVSEVEPDRTSLFGEMGERPDDPDAMPRTVEERWVSGEWNHEPEKKEPQAEPVEGVKINLNPDEIIEKLGVLGTFRGLF